MVGCGLCILATSLYIFANEVLVNIDCDTGNLEAAQITFKLPCRHALDW